MRSVSLALVLLLSAATALAQNGGTIPAPPDVAGPPPSAVRTPSGLAYRVLRPARVPGLRARPTSTVEVHYTGWQTDGTMFDSSRVRGAPASFPLTGTIRGFAEGVAGMGVGEIRRIWIPEALGYGPTGAIPGMLVFDVELLSIPTP